MEVSIIKRQLNNEEISLLTKEVRKFYSPVVGYADKWKHFTTVYIATINNQLVGVCGVEKIKNWLMLHPFVVLEEYHGKGIGMKLMENIIAKNPTKNIFIGSQNSAVHKIVTKLGFTKTKTLALPQIVKLYLLTFTLESMNMRFIKEFIRKRKLPHGTFYNFIKLHKNTVKS